MSWLQLHIDTYDHHIPEIETALFYVGAASVTFMEYIPNGKSEQPILEPALGEAPLWQYTRITGLFDAMVDTASVDALLHQQLLSIVDSRQGWHWQQLEDKDWEREWMQYYHPIQCADNVWICPGWITPPDPAATTILMDPGLAFGTGTHPSTFLCVQWLSRQKLEQSYVLDYGCGSGILGIAALLLGARQVTGVDIDPQALMATQDNRERNQLPLDALITCLPQDCPSHPVDVILANILAEPLIQLADTLIGLIKPRGIICLSGILEHQSQAVMDAYSHAIAFDQIKRQGEWTCLSGCRL